MSTELLASLSVGGLLLLWAIHTVWTWARSINATLRDEPDPTSWWVKNERSQPWLKKLDPKTREDILFAQAWQQKWAVWGAVSEQAGEIPPFGMLETNAKIRKAFRKQLR